MGEGHSSLGRCGEAEVGVADHRRPRAGGGGGGDQGEGEGAAPRADHPDGAPPPQAVGQQISQDRGHRQGALAGRGPRAGTAGRLGEGPWSGTRGGGGLLDGIVVERLGLSQQAGEKCECVAG